MAAVTACLAVHGGQRRTPAPQRAAAPAKAAKPAYSPPRTAWGDPRSRPARTPTPGESGDAVQASEAGYYDEEAAPESGSRPPRLAKAIEQQQPAQGRARAPTLEAASPAPARRPDSLVRGLRRERDSRPWMVTDPPDGKGPPTTDEAKQRAAILVAALHRQLQPDRSTARRI